MENSSPNTLSKYAPVVLRLGLGAVIFWFGLNEVLNPAAWVSYIPSWTNSWNVSSVTLLYINGAFEIVAGVMLVLGIYVRVISFFLFLHILLIILEIGLTSIGMRDVGLAAALLSLSIGEKDEFSFR